jgi:hypothetical protein
MEKFKVGDTVQVVDPGSTYTTYGAMFKKMKFKNSKENYGFSKGTIATVFAIGDHELNGCTLLGLQAPDGSQALLGAEGVCKVVTSCDKGQMFDIIRQFCDEQVTSQKISDRDIFVFLLQKSCK